MKNQILWEVVIGLHIAVAVAVGGCRPSLGVECGDGWCSDEEICVDPQAAQPVCVRGTCGNHRLDVGEECDDGNNTGGDGCSPNCMVEGCGNGILEPGEQCDDGNIMGGDGCSASCTIEVCGNGILDRASGEQCDDGNAIDSDGCSANCRLPSCGNGIKDPYEQCDDGNAVDGDGCSVNCTTESCGNGILDRAHGEECDDGNTIEGDGCSANCKLPSCGNGIKELYEQCDDGNIVSGDSCSASCTREICGNGILDYGEQCDDGNLIEGDGCSVNCKLERCGNGVVDKFEECDGLAGLQPCSSSCRQERCGNGILDPGEQCEDGNVTSGDGCSATCQREFCGNGHIDPGEVCDDGDKNGTPGDPCTDNCRSSRQCGNGVVDVGEECDDGLGGVQKNSARCNSDCTFARCGDGKVNDLFKPDGVNPEVCDNLDPVTHASLNGVPCDYGNPFCTRCNATCTGTINPGGPFCGDTLAQTGFGEQCDPATGPALTMPSLLARADSVTCDIDCTLVTCGDGHLNMVALETCDDGNQSACGTCPSTTPTDCRGMAPITPTQATSTITTDNGDKIGDGDTLRLDDGFGKTITLEFDLGGLQDPNAVPIAFAQSPATSAATIASRMVNAINTRAAPGFLITAVVPPGGTTVILINARKSSFGNTPIVVTGQIGITGGFTFSASPPAMVGGFAGDCLAGTGCVVGDDCKSGVCSATSHQCQ